MNNRIPTLDEVFSPRGVALVGVSPNGRNYVANIMSSLREAGFPAIYPINPRYTEIMGLHCYPNLQAVPGIVDHVIVGIPAESVLALLDDCIAKGIRSIHFFTAGFRESGIKERAELEQKMLEKAIIGKFRIFGPNCTGIFVPKSRLITSRPAAEEAGSIAFVSQSGGHANNLPNYSMPRGLHFSKIVSYGNALDVDENELLEYFAQDPETKIIAAYIEGVKNGRRFIETLRKASSVKPVIMYKGGTTEAGKRAAQGHTASLTSSVAVFETVCRQMRTIHVDDIDEMIDVMVALQFMNPIPKGKSVVVLGGGGGPSVLASDEMEKAGLTMPPLSSTVQAELLKYLPLAGSILNNPIDASNLASPEGISATMQIVSQLPEINALVYHLGFHPIGSWGQGRFSTSEFLKPTIQAMLQTTRTTGKPVILALRPPMDLNSMKEFLTAQEAFVKAGIPVFHSLHQAGKAIALVINWNQSRV